MKRHGKSAAVAIGIVAALASALSQPQIAAPQTAPPTLRGQGTVRPDVLIVRGIPYYVPRVTPGTEVSFSIKTDTARSTPVSSSANAAGIARARLFWTAAAIFQITPGPENGFRNAIVNAEWTGKDGTRQQLAKKLSILPTDEEKYGIRIIAPATITRAKLANPGVAIVVTGCRPNAKAYMAVHSATRSLLRSPSTQRRANHKGRITTRIRWNRKDLKEAVIWVNCRIPKRIIGRRTTNEGRARQLLTVSD